MNKIASTDTLKTAAYSVRESIIRMSADGGCFIGASLSCADLLVFLYYEFLNINKDNLDSDSRDYLFLSKGHDVPALYGTLAEKGIIDKSRLKNHLKTNDYLYWHPNVNIPGVEFHSGSLGHLLSVAMGVAIDCKLKKTSNKIVVILGDGELNEGSVWESVLVCRALGLDNLTAVVDRNQFQANMKTEELIPLEPLEKKFEAFGWIPYTCNGHNFDDLRDTFNRLKDAPAFPKVIIADTIRGKGLPSLEEKADRWFCNFSNSEVDSLIEELKGNSKADITNKTLMVR